MSLPIIHGIKWRCRSLQRRFYARQLKRAADVFFDAPMAFSLSMKHRQQHNIRYDSRYIYGTITADGVVSFCQYFDCPQFTTCIDFGCGDGMALFMFSSVLRTNFAIGIEIIEPLVQRAKAIGAQIESCLPMRMIYHHMDFRDFCLPKMPCFVLFNASGYFGDAWLEILPLFEKCATGSMVCTISRAIDVGAFRLLGSYQIRCSWGWATAYCHQKI